MTDNKIIIDATNAPLGRLASFAAKQSLFGKSIVIVNCNSAIISGRRRSVIGEYKIARQRGGSSLKGPFFPKDPFRLVKRTIRGMLPYKNERGRTALKRIICFNDIPQEYEKAHKISLLKELKIKTINLEELSREI